MTPAQASRAECPRFEAGRGRPGHVASEPARAHTIYLRYLRIILYLFGTFLIMNLFLFFFLYRNYTSFVNLFAIWSLLTPRARSQLLYLTPYHEYYICICIDTHVCTKLTWGSALFRELTSHIASCVDRTHYTLWHQYVQFRIVLYTLSNTLFYTRVN